jgi:hypothetical protein
VAVAVWLVLLGVFAAVVAVVLHLLREQTRAADESRPDTDRVNTQVIWKAAQAFLEAEGRLPAPPGAEGGPDRFLSEVESMQVLRALAGGEPAINPGRTPYLQLPLLGADGRLLDRHARQVVFKLDLDGDGQVSHRGWVLHTRVLVLSRGPDGRVDVAGGPQADDVFTPTPWAKPPAESFPAP